MLFICQSSISEILSFRDFSMPELGNVLSFLVKTNAYLAKQVGRCLSEGQSAVLNVGRKPGFDHRDVDERRSCAGRASAPVREADERSEGIAKRREDLPGRKTPAHRRSI